MKAPDEVDRAPTSSGGDEAPTEIVRRPRERDPNADTVAEPRPAIETTSPRTTRSGTLETPAEASRHEEIRRTRSFATIAAVFAVVVLVVLPLLGGDGTAKASFAITLALVLVSSLVLLRAMRSDEGYTVERAFAFGLLCIATAFGAIFFFGVFSPAAVVVPFGLYSFSVGQSRRSTIGVYALCAGLELALGVPTALGWIADRGILKGDAIDVPTRLLVVFLVEAVFFATFVIARASRAAWIHAIERHEAAVRGLLTREELLREAKEELARALEAGNLGRFTDDTIGGYRLGDVLGRGGMGEVYEAVHVATNAPAAVKLLHHHALSDPANVRRFLREARIVASIDSPNVVKVLEASGLESDGLPFIAMELLRGKDLSEMLREQRRLSIPKVLQLVREVAAGLEAARAKDVVHRDIKPRNLFFAESGDRGTWKILDFGVSRLVADQATLTGEQMLGTPSYMAPEQVASGKVDHRADLYSLGVCCYRALTGRPAAAGDQVAEILYKVVNTMPAKPTATARVHEDVDAVFAIALAKSPDDRFDRAAELAQALEAAARGSLSDELRARAERILAKHPWSEG